MIERAVAALRAGEPVVLPTDTVYGLAAEARNEAAVRVLYRLKGRAEPQPTAVVSADAESLVEALPELRGAPMLAGPYTLILPNPERRFPWLTGGRPDTIGVRIPDLPRDALEVVRQVGLLAATSANLPGGADPRRVEEIPAEILAGSGAVVDAGELPGTPSTVIDLTGSEPVVVREGAVPAAEALALLA
ncbi:MAG: L-threonylcarbamoyladenylate synthase [Gaiellaceae bacterium]